MKNRFVDEGIKTSTSIFQMNMERKVDLFSNYSSSNLFFNNHLKYIFNFFNSNINEDKEYNSLWFPFYAAFIFRISDEFLSKKSEDVDYEYNSIYEGCFLYLSRRTNRFGCFSLFEIDYPNLILNYAAINALILIGNEKGFDLLEPAKIYDLLLVYKQDDGSFVPVKGECADVRSTFCAIYIAYMVGILDNKLSKNTTKFIVSCQNYDGGFSPVPNSESHSGYVHCAVATLLIFNALNEVNIHSLIRWLVNRQMTFHGGFNGRPNKLVDSCYTWWQGSSMIILSDFLGIDCFWNNEALETFILKEVQFSDGGFCDHVGSSSDQFHTVFSLAGLFVCLRSKYRVEIDPISCAPTRLVNEFREHFNKKKDAT